MTVRAHSQRALDRVGDERVQIVETRTASDAFERTARDHPVFRA